jgi:hypothetical protein
VKGKKEPLFAGLLRNDFCSKCIVERATVNSSYGSIKNIRRKTDGNTAYLRSIVDETET